MYVNIQFKLTSVGLHISLCMVVNSTFEHWCGCQLYTVYSLGVNNIIEMGVQMALFIIKPWVYSITDHDDSGVNSFFFV